MSNQIVVGIADMKMATNQEILITYALGSCVGIALYDSVTRIGALIHIMLPSVMETDVKNTFKYADSAVIATIIRLNGRGVPTSRLTAKIAGGAKMFAVDNGMIGSIGSRNVDAVKTVLRKYGIPIHAEDTGLSLARTMSLDAKTGQVSIKAYGRDIKML